MNLYKCTVAHRNGQPNDTIYTEIFWIEADCGLAAYIKAREMTKNLDRQVYEPEIQLYIRPKAEYTCTLPQMIKEYGTRAYQKAKRDTECKSWRKVEAETPPWSD